MSENRNGQVFFAEKLAYCAIDLKQIPSPYTTLKGKGGGGEMSSALGKINNS